MKRTKGSTSKVQRLNFWFRVFASYLLILFSFDLLPRLTHLGRVMGDRGVIVSIAGTMLGLMALAFIMAALVALFSWRDKALLWLSSLMFFPFVLVGAANCVRLFWFSSVMPKDSYIILLALAGIIYLAIVFLMGREAVKEFLFSKIVVPLKYLFIIIILGCLVLGLNLMAQTDTDKGTNQNNKSNVILITVDNLPYNQVSWEGTPNLMKLAQNSYNFTNTSTCYPMSRSNLSALFNSNFDLSGWSRSQAKERLMPKTAAVLLCKNGFLPLAVIPQKVAYYLEPSLIKQFGDVVYSNQGNNLAMKLFYRYDRLMRRELKANTYLNGIWDGYFGGLNIVKENDAAAHIHEILNHEKRRPLFLWIHEPEPNNLDYLKIKELYEKSIIIVVGTKSPQAPLIIHLPDQVNGRDINCSSSIIDVVPTILELLDIPRPNWVKGESLVKCFNGERTGNYKYQIAWVFNREKKKLPPRKYLVVIKDNYQLNYFTDNQEAALFDLKNDPKKEKNLAKAKPQIQAKLRDEAIKVLSF
ncbi:MAG: sulfatase/phosphatase domain-containing protein [bacterium]